MNDIAKNILNYLQCDKSRRRWRLIAIVALILVGVNLIPNNLGTKGEETNKPFIAKIHITGMILENQHQQNVLLDIAKNEHAKGLIVHVDSPGGTMVGGITLYHALRHVARTKPVVVVQGTVAASAGYLVSLAGDHIFTNEGTLTGSVGVLLPLVDATELATKLGIKSDEVVSGGMKSVTSPLWKRGVSERQYLQGVVNSLNTVFYKYVQKRRPNLTSKVLTLIKDGRAVVGVDAFSMGLVDEIGGIGEAKQWLISKLSLPKDIFMIDIDLEEDKSFLQKALKGSLWSSEIKAMLQPAVWAVVY